MREADPKVHYYQSTDSSRWCLESILFQLVDESCDNKVTHSYKKKYTYHYIHVLLVRKSKNLVCYYGNGNSNVTTVPSKSPVADYKEQISQQALYIQLCVGKYFYSKIKCI